MDAQRDIGTERAELQWRRAGRPATQNRVSPPMPPSELARLTRLGALLPQELVESFILDVRMVTNRLVVDALLNLQKGAPATRRGRAGGLGRARLASVGVVSCLCRVGWAGGCLSACV